MTTESQRSKENLLDSWQQRVKQLKAAYSGAKLPPIPFYCYHRFRCIVTTHSGTL